MDEPPIPSTTYDPVDHPPLGSARAAEGLPRRRFTVAEVEAMQEACIIVPDERLELIGGDLVPMSPKGLAHETLKGALVRRWFRCAPDETAVVPAATFRLSVNTYLEVDVLLLDETAGLEAALSNLSGRTALLVVEIADSSLDYDLGRKAKLYASFGVRELWVIDAVKETIRVFRYPAENGYAEVLELARDVIATPLFAPGVFALRLTDLGLPEKP